MEAHSEEELQEWRSRARAARKKASGAEDQGLLSYQDRLLEEYRTSSNPEHIVSTNLKLYLLFFSQRRGEILKTVLIYCHYCCDLFIV